MVREYVGGGEAGELAAEFDALQRERRELERERWKEEKAEVGELDSRAAECCSYADLIAAAAMTAAGYHQHRGQWRRRGGRT